MGKFIHGMAKRSQRPPEYGVWCKMRQRCDDPNAKQYADYGGRGIKVCGRWYDFAAFLADMGPRPTADHTIDRTNNDLGYSPGNCTWATRLEQSRNRRPRKVQEVCKRGHSLTDAYSRPDGKRGCRVCRAANLRDFYARKLEAAQ